MSLQAPRLVKNEPSDGLAKARNWTIPMLSGMIAEFKPPLVPAFCNLKLRVCFAPVLQAGLNQRRKIPMVEAKCQT
jgi:hypothetical protein